MTWALKLLSGWRGYALALAAGMLCSWLVQGWRWTADVAVIERNQARADAQASQQALASLQSNIETVAAAGQRAAAVAPALAREINRLTGALKDAPPLPDNCRPDAVRMRSLESAVGAANRAAAGQSAGAVVPANP